MENKKILMIDDDKYIIEELGFFIKKRGGHFFFKLFNEGDEYETVEYIEKLNPDIIILDYNLSYKIKGIDIMKMLSDENKKRVIGFSSLENLKDTFLESGASGFVWKGEGKGEKLTYLLEEEFKKINPNP